MTFYDFCVNILFRVSFVNFQDRKGGLLLEVPPEDLRLSIQLCLNQQAERLRLFRERTEELLAQYPLGNGGKHDRNDFGTGNSLALDGE